MSQEVRLMIVNRPIDAEDIPAGFVDSVVQVGPFRP
jgi:hypothetical protein